MKNESTAGLLKIGELAKAAGTNVSTIKFYVKEGLIQAASKTSPNMAYYHSDAIARVQLIKSLQKEHYYPLSLIKHMLDAANTNQTEMELLDAIHKVDPKSSSKTFAFSEAVKMTGLSRSQIEALIEKKLVKPEISGKKQWFSEPDLQVMILIRRRMEAGIPFDESVASFVIYENSLKSAAKADVDLFISHALLTSAPTSEEAVRMISVSDETLDTFISLKRSELNREYGSERISDLDHFASNLSKVLQTIGSSLKQLGYPVYAEQCFHAMTNCPKENDPVSASLRFYHLVINSLSGSLAKSISVCGQAHAHFNALQPEKSDGEEALLLYSLRVCWLVLAPSLLEYAEEAKKTLGDFSAFASRCIGKDADFFTKQMISAISVIAGAI